MERIYVMIAVHAMKENMLKQLIGLKTSVCYPTLSK